MHHHNGDEFHFIIIIIIIIICIYPEIQLNRVHPNPILLHRAFLILEKI